MCSSGPAEAGHHRCVRRVRLKPDTTDVFVGSGKTRTLPMCSARVLVVSAFRRTVGGTMNRAVLSLLMFGAFPSLGLAQPVTFSKDVAPILQKACQNCHRPGAIAPMSLLTYQDARPWAKSIKAKVASREM